MPAADDFGGDLDDQEEGEEDELVGDLAGDFADDLGGDLARNFPSDFGGALAGDLDFLEAY